MFKQEISHMKCEVPLYLSTMTWSTREEEKRLQVFLTSSLGRA